MEFFTFEPGDFQVLEDIEFDETIQRPEKIRFFTFGEQTTDAYEKLMPRGRVTRFQREEVRTEVDRLRDLYTEYIVAMPTDYALREPTYGKKLPWVHPVFAESSYKSYNWATQWRPLFENLRLPGFYPRLLASLPRPYGDTATGAPYSVSEATEYTDTNGKAPRRVLPEYVMIRTQHHEDKTIDVVKVPVEGTEDAVNSVGYFLEPRSLEIPNPFPDHPFLKSNAATFIDSTAPLDDVVPSLDAILTHAVPVTSDPYREAEPFLKLYDVRLGTIPWSTWKSKFPPVEIVNDMAAAAPIDYPKPSQLAPPENVVEAYKSTYSPGVSVRLWLMQQLDGGGLIPELLRSTAIDNGSVESVPGVDLQQAAYPDSSIDECSLNGKSWNDFLITGILRRTFVEKDKDPYAIMKYQCVPLEFIKQERARIGYLNRKPWTESTGEDIKKEYIRRLESIRPRTGRPEPKQAAPKTPQRPDSVRRAEVLAILEDPRRFADDKLRDIREVLKETTLTKQIYSDTDGLFVCCAHTLAVLGGDLEADRRAFYDTWTARIDGFRVCKYCGEQINSDVFVDQVQFDEDGFVIKRTEAFEQTSFHGSTVRPFATGMASLRPLFVDGNAHDDIVFLMLSILHVLPTADALEPLLKFGRTVASVQFTKGTADEIAKFTGITGIATTALLMQTHLPTLVPRRSFGPTPLKFNGYPRDSPTPEERTIVDTLLMVIRKTFESFPTSFKGPSQQTIRAVLTSSSQVRTAVANLLSAKSPLLKGFEKLPSPVPALLAIAKAYYVQNPPRVEQPKTLIPVVRPPKELGVFPTVVTCPSSRPVWTSGRSPKVVQQVVALRPSIRAATNAVFVPPSSSRRVALVRLAPDEIRANLAKERGLQTGIPIRDTAGTNLAVASRIADMFLLPAQVRSVDPTEKASTLRDTSRAILADVLSKVQQDPTKRAILEEQRTKDIALYALTADYKEEKANVNKLVAAERMRFVQRLALQSDAEREVLQELLQIGLAPYIISRKDREEFAREAERLREEVYRDELVIQAMDGEIGVGQPSDYFEQGDEPPRGVDNGDYGDYLGMPENEDYNQPQINDDAESSI